MAWTRLALAGFCSLRTTAAAAGQVAAPQPTAAPATPAAAPPPKTGLPAALPAGTTRPTTGPTGSPFDAYDPEIRAVGQLNWKDANFDKLDVPTRGAAL